MARLNQIIAVEKGVKSRSFQEKISKVFSHPTAALAKIRAVGGLNKLGHEKLPFCESSTNLLIDFIKLPFKIFLPFNTNAVLVS